MIGAFWYLFAVERKDRCWRVACHRHSCNSNDLYCGGVNHGDTSFLKSTCLPLEPHAINTPADFDFGIFLDAHQSHVVEHTQFLRKFCYCFWWGLRNLRFVPFFRSFLDQLVKSQKHRSVHTNMCFTYCSSLGQNLKTSNFVWEILFAVFISITGLVLFSLLIGNMQVCSLYDLYILQAFGFKFNHGCLKLVFLAEISAVNHC